MDGVAVALQTSEEEEGEEADGEADERHGDTHGGDDSKKIVDAPIPLWINTCCSMDRPSTPHLS